MVNQIEIKTNNVPRFLLDGWELSTKEREEFDYIEDVGEEIARFFRYKDRIYDSHEFQTTAGMPEGNPLKQWDGIQNDSFFSGIVIRFVSLSETSDAVIVGTYIN